MKCVDAAAAWKRAADALVWETPPAEQLPCPRECDKDGSRAWCAGGRLDYGLNILGARAASRQGGDEALTIYKQDGVERYTYTRLWESVQRLSLFLCSRGVKPSSRVLMLLRDEDKELQVLLMLALLARGAQFGFLFSRMPGPLIEAQLNKARPDLFIFDAGLHHGRCRAARAALSGADVLRGLRQTRLTQPGVPQPCLSDAQDPRVLVCTSGTTAAPKMVMTGHAGYFGSLTIFERERLKLNSSSAFFITLLAPFGPTVGLYCAAFMAGARVVVCEERGYLGSRRFAGIIARERVDACAMVPAFLEKVRYNVKAPLKLAFTGDSMTPEHWELCCRLFPRARVLNVYGLAETMACLDSGLVAAKPRNARRINRLRPFPGVAYVLKNKDSRGSGELWIRDFPGLCRGYLGERAAFSARFAGALFDTRDVARLDGGALELVGRKDSLTKVNCRFLEPRLIEQAARGVAGVKRAKALCGTGVYLCVEGAPAGKKLSGMIEKRIAQRVGSYAVPRRIVFVDALPVTETGKPDERKLWQLINGT